MWYRVLIEQDEDGMFIEKDRVFHRSSNGQLHYP